MTYNWQQEDWPSFRFDLSTVEEALFAFVDKAGQVNGMLKGLPDATRIEVTLQVMIAEAMKTSEIEGEYLSRQDVVSSMRNQLGLNDPHERVKDNVSKGAAEMMVAAREGWAEPLSEAMLFSWHRMLMKAARGIDKVGAWRTDETPMQVVSNPYGNRKVHFEAPFSNRVPEEMKAFIDWFNESENTVVHGPVRAAIAHLYFESIHPFEDGNGRIGRAISEKAISQGLSRPAVLSFSRTIEAKKNRYYDALEDAQKSNEISSWIHYFVKMALVAQEDAERQVEFVLRKTKFFDCFRSDLNDRQLKVIRRMLDEGPDSFEGGMNARKYISIAKTSKATATRDLQRLVELGVLEPHGGGRSARYRLLV